MNVKGFAFAALAAAVGIAVLALALHMTRGSEITENIRDGLGG